MLLEIPVCGGNPGRISHLNTKPLETPEGKLDLTQIYHLWELQNDCSSPGNIQFRGGPAVTLLPGDKQKSVVDGTN